MRKWVQVGVVGALVSLLVGTNAWWALGAAENGVSRQYLADAAENECEALNQSLALLPELLAGTPKAAVEQKLRTLLSGAEPFEKDGFLWVGELGFRFERDKLVEVKRSWEPSLCETVELAQPPQR